MRIARSNTIRLGALCGGKTGLQREEYPIITTAFEAEQTSLSGFLFLFVAIIKNFTVRSLDVSVQISIEAHCYFCKYFCPVLSLEYKNDNNVKSKFMCV